jgi:hypothetical protein
MDFHLVAAGIVREIAEPFSALHTIEGGSRGPSDRPDPMARLLSFSATC